ncbi:MAG: glycosyltransferase family 2 protein [Nitrososphaerota archaeon]
MGGTIINTPLVSIIILNYNGRQHIEHCLDSVQKILYPNLETIVVDNASVDGSPELIQQKYSFVCLIKNSKNIGFSAGNNVGISKAKGNYIFLLNPDTEVHPICVKRLVEVMERNKNIGVCGAKILLFDRREVIQHAGGKYHPIGIAIDRGVLEIDLGQYDKVEEVTFVCGAAMLFRKELVSKVGMLDPNFFLYHEDVDFCIRTWLNGFKVVYVPDAVVYHKSGYLTELAKHVRRSSVVFHTNKNSLIILLKNFSAFMRLTWLPISLLYKMLWILWFLFNHDAHNALAVIKSITWIMKNTDLIKVKRKKTARKLKMPLAGIRDVWQLYRKLSSLYRGKQ